MAASEDWNKVPGDIYIREWMVQVLCQPPPAGHRDRRGRYLWPAWRMKYRGWSNVCTCLPPRGASRPWRCAGCRGRWGRDTETSRTGWGWTRGQRSGSWPKTWTSRSVCPSGDGGSVVLDGLHKTQRSWTRVQVGRVGQPETLTTEYGGTCSHVSWTHLTCGLGQTV